VVVGRDNFKFVGTGRGVVAEENLQVGKNLDEGERFVGGLPMVGEAQVAGGDGVAGADLPGDDGDVVFDVVEVAALEGLQVFEFAGEEIDMAADDGERVVDVVHDAGVNLVGGAGHFLAQGDVAEAAVEVAQSFGGVDEISGDVVQLEGAGGGGADGGEIEGLAEVVAGAEAEGLAGGLQGLVGGEHDDLGGGADLLEGVQDVEAGAAGHADVE